MGGAGVDVDGEVEEVAQREPGAPVLAHARRLQDVEALDDDDVGTLDDDLLVGHDVVDEVGVDGGLDLVATGLDVDDEAQQRAAVVGLREALALQQPAPVELGVGVEEAVGGHQRHPRVLGPVGQHLLQHARGGRLADRHRPGEPDDERRARRGGAVQEVLLAAVQAPGALDVEAEQPAQRQVDLLDLLQVQRVAEPAQGAHLVGAQRVGRLVGQLGPGRAVELDVGRGARVVLEGREGLREDAPEPARASAPGMAAIVAALARARSTRPGSVESRSMCGIVGYVGSKQAQAVVIEGLRRLEYRGYDSAGIALVDGGTVGRRQAGRQAGQPREGDRRPPAAGVLHRHRPHPLGHPRRADRRQRPPPPGRRAPGGAGAQRHHRELRRAPRRPRARGPPSCSPRPTPRSPRTCSRSRWSRPATSPRPCSRCAATSRAPSPWSPSTPRTPTGSSLRAAARRWWWAWVTARRSSAPTSRRSSSTPARPSSSTRTRSSPSPATASRSAASTARPPRVGATTSTGTSPRPRRTATTGSCARRSSSSRAPWPTRCWVGAAPRACSSSTRCA